MASIRICLCALVMLTLASPVVAQPAATAADPTITLLSNARIEAQVRTLTESATKSPTGVSFTTLETYPGYSVMLVVRVKTGPSEMHANWNDVMYILDGDATEVTGGTMADGKLDAATGETRGTGVEGGTRTPIGKGDVIHIPANTPHWAILAPGKTQTILLVKVATTGLAGSR